jgi:hypothetical protein
VKDFKITCNNVSAFNLTNYNSQFGSVKLLFSNVFSSFTALVQCTLFFGFRNIMNSAQYKSI